MEDSRYATLRILIEAGSLINLREIFDYIPVETLAADLKDDAGRLRDLYLNARDITMNEINALAELIDCDFEKVAMLAAGQYQRDMEK